jgi:hypothetical protein
MYITQLLFYYFFTTIFEHIVKKKEGSTGTVKCSATNFLVPLYKIMMRLKSARGVNLNRIEH